MTDTIEQKALAVFNEAMNTDATRLPDLVNRKALLRAIEQHEAFRQEVSDAVEWVVNSTYMPAPSEHKLRRFIAKPDPLVEAIKDCELATLDGIEEGVAYDLRAAIEKRGGKIIFNEEQN